ncbi:aspartate-semialdehyde dehydrogenase [Staphylococcus epidermidis]|uniref:aspartate-semialdehyde dehydrogenase n=1 Tax=Staphylococcus epidermidis TaxID=1282 RepID=UPI0028788C98|nr:aspartate-semialdehyde dehydrogenase [Staphylococcus epidermidis]MDS3977097.1 aspartate-semialdehyde dehydrogenase [Staphylococcus epidermidis]MDT0758554.1 aspartate-semialdehyde dehydrogenase [Staphylococcus epidermidis]
MKTNKLSENQIQKIISTFIHIKTKTKMIIDEKQLIQSITKYINKKYNDIIFTESIPKDSYLGMRKIDNEPKLFENLVNILIKNTNIKRREYHYQVVFTIIREVCSFHYYINDYTYEEILEAMRLK